MLADRPAYGLSNFSLQPDLDDIPALSTEQHALWARLEKSTFLTSDEKRAAVGYGPKPAEQKFNPNHHPANGQFTTAEGAGGDRADIIPAAGGPRPPPTPPRRPPPPPPGHNRPPTAPTPRLPGGTTTSGPANMSGPEATGAYRSIYGYPEAGSRYYTGTVAHAEVDGEPYLGVSSTMPGYTQEDRTAADAMRDTLIKSDPDIMNVDKITQMPNIAVYHAESTALMRAARSNNGTLYGRTMDMYVDREMCANCYDVLPLVGRELGNPTVNFVDRLGNRKTLRNGAWE